jgi:hypothetical protein
VVHDVILFKEGEDSAVLFVGDFGDIVWRKRSGLQGGQGWLPGGQNCQVERWEGVCQARRRGAGVLGYCHIDRGLWPGNTDSRVESSQNLVPIDKHPTRGRGGCKGYRSLIS